MNSHGQALESCRAIVKSDCTGCAASELCQLRGVKLMLIRKWALRGRC